MMDSRGEKKPAQGGLRIVRGFTTAGYFVVTPGQYGRGVGAPPAAMRIKMEIRTTRTVITAKTLTIVFCCGFAIISNMRVRM
jgi:hypothetical protein